MATASRYLSSIFGLRNPSVHGTHQFLFFTKSSFFRRILNTWDSPFHSIFSVVIPFMRLHVKLTVLRTHSFLYRVLCRNGRRFSRHWNQSPFFRLLHGLLFLLSSSGFSIAGFRLPVYSQIRQRNGEKFYYHLGGKVWYTGYVGVLRGTPFFVYISA